MRSLARWEPFNDLISLRDAMDRFFERSFFGGQPTEYATRSAGSIPLDIVETDQALVIRAFVPGVQPADIDITVSGETLTIQGEMGAAEDLGAGNYICRECPCGPFVRSITLPPNLKTDDTEAEFVNGVLTLRIPKAEQQEPRTIQVKKTI